MGTPIAIHTIFGWAILGQYSGESPKQAINVVTTVTQDPIDDVISRFWKVEEPPDQPSLFTPTEELVQHHYAETHTYVPEPGHYVVKLPRKNDQSTLGPSRAQAIDRFMSNERSLIRKGTHKQFQAVVREYLDLKHAEPVPPSDQSAQTEHYYLQMHGVTKASSTSTKLGVVFDASARTTTQLSLNDILHAGPTIQPTLEHILFQFRTHSIAITADISKMYRSVHLHPKDRDLHRFIWTEDPSVPLKDYRMTRVTFGVTASPYLAIKTLQQTAHDFIRWLLR